MENVLSERSESKGNLLATEKAHFAYILQCADGSFYVGSTADFQLRLRAHQTGKAAAYTAARRPVRLVYHQRFPSRGDAVERERQVKRWTHHKKQALIAGDMVKLKTLGRRRPRTFASLLP
ncbi:hypothetical protein LCGC14_0335190 [marine sediment metagenome]|uniref:GIY-YIG domain-containing protein n=1 Tax=marine sediment metagenome TaxID=412755 RepID=A0A0F9W2J9_9ZZZZ|nr:GIY-YIG nuclease family protein [Phycisphaerae bacterium]HDZ43725.1 GIY-YIG nuclease family protein [Phycisphaerae bacterium]